MKVVRVFSSVCHRLVSIVWTHNARDFLLFAKSRSTVCLMPLNKNIHVMHRYIHFVSVGLLRPTTIILILLLYRQGTHTSTYTHNTLEVVEIPIWMYGYHLWILSCCTETTAAPSTQYQCITVILQLERSTEEKHPVHTWGRLTWHEGTVTAQTQTKISHFR